MKIILIVLLLMLIPIPVQAQDRVVLGNYEAVIIGYDRDGRPIYQMEMTPKYADGQPIDTQWHLQGDSYVNGKNLFNSYVSNEFVSVTDKNLNDFSWQPTVTLGTEVNVKDKKPKLLNVDPLNENYRNNTLEWDYGNGIYRRLRLIEGSQQEYYVITKPVNEDFKIKSNVSSAKLTPNKPVAWDADGKIVELTTLNHDMTLKKGNYKYPITIDPDLTFTSTSSDGGLRYYSTISFANARTAVNATYVETGAVGSAIRTLKDGTDYTVERVGVFFDTSVLSGYTVTAAELNLYAASALSADGESVQIQSGMPNYPHDPMVAGDYDLTNYAGNGGSKAINTFAVGYNTITLNAAGIAMINTSGTTKFLLRTTGDINNTAPTGNNFVYMYTYEKGLGYRPQLEVTFTPQAPGVISVAASDIASTTARLNSTVTDDGVLGAETCQIRFGYGTTTQIAANFALYDTVTAWVDGYNTGDNPFLDVSGLVADTDYFFRVQIKNSHSTVTSVDEQTFHTIITVDDMATFTGYPSDTSISLSWVKSSGANKTMIRYRLDTYPTSESGADGSNQVYFSTGTAYVHSNLNPGTTYYYSAWGESGGTYSTNEVNLVMTTSSEVDSEDLPSGATPPNWFQEPDETFLANLQPLYSIVNGLADDWQMPRANMWLGLVLGFIFVVGAGIYITLHAPALAMVIMAFLMLAFVTLHILPLFFLVFVFLLGLGAWATRPQGI